LVSFPANLIEGANSISITGSNTAGTDTEIQTINFQKPVTILPPVVTFITPNIDPITSQTSSYNVSATVLNVGSVSGIQVKLNGINVTNFAFNSSSSLVSFPANLIEGANSISITGTNTAGTDTEIQTINFQKPVTILPPVVTFINPAASGTIVSEDKLGLISVIQYVENSGQIELTQNGNIINPASYTFDVTTKKVLYNTILAEGNNLFTVKGTNVSGTDMETTSVFFRKPIPPCQAPIITIQAPVVTETTVNSCVFKAKVENITSLSQIHFVLNGSTILDGNFDPSSQLFSKNVVLQKGVNIFNIAVLNDCGSAKDQKNISYSPVVLSPCLTPSIVITSSSDANNTITKNTSFTLSAVLTNIETTSQILIKQNDLAINFDFDPQTHVVQINTLLKLGINKFVIEATNKCGKAVKNHLVTLENGQDVNINAPVITITEPSTFPISIEKASTIVTGNITKVTDVNQVIITVNGQVITAYNPVFNSSGMTFKFALDATPQTSIFQLNFTAINSFGKAIKKGSITLKPSATNTPPVANPPKGKGGH
jgi:large repetitive protein